MQGPSQFGWIRRSTFVKTTSAATGYTLAAFFKDINTILRIGPLAKYGIKFIVAGEDVFQGYC